MLLRWVRHGAKHNRWRPLWLFGLVEIVTYEQPRYRSVEIAYFPPIKAIAGFSERPAMWVTVPA